RNDQQLVVRKNADQQKEARRDDEREHEHDRLAHPHVGGDRFGCEELREERPHEDDERRATPATNVHHAFIASTSPLVRSPTFSSATSAANTASSDGSRSVARRFSTESCPT